MATCIFLPSISNSITPFKHIINPSTNSQITPHSSLTNLPLSSKSNLLNLISDQNRGLNTQNNPKKLAQIIQAIDEMAVMGRDSITTGKSLTGTWRLLWTTEKEQLFIIKNASLFGTKAGDVLQVIDVENLCLNNVITFPPDGLFFVRSNIQIASSQRVNFRYIRCYFTSNSS